MLESLRPQLVARLVRAGRLDQALALFDDPAWRRRCPREEGLERVLADAEAVAQAAVRERQPEVLVARGMLRHFEVLHDQSEASWQDCRAAKRLAAATRPERMCGARVRAIGSSPGRDSWACSG